MSNILRVNVPDADSVASEIEKIEDRLATQDYEIGQVAKAVLEEHFRSAGQEEFCKPLMKSMNPADWDILASATSSESIKQLINLIKYNNY